MTARQGGVCDHHIHANPNPALRSQDKNRYYRHEFCCKCRNVRECSRIKQSGCDWECGPWDVPTAEVLPQRVWANVNCSNTPAAQS